MTAYELIELLSQYPNDTVIAIQLDTIPTGEVLPITHIEEVDYIPNTILVRC